jgi:hypothetical protein
MYYAISKSKSGYKGHAFWMFKTLTEANESGKIDHNSIVYNGNRPQVLLETISSQKLKNLWDKVGIPTSFVSMNQLVEHLHDLVDAKAILWKQDMEKPMSEAEPKARTRLNPDARIIRQVETPALREGTNRHRNQQVVLQCATVREAMERLRALQPSPGGGVDIQIAIKSGAIRLEE